MSSSSETANLELNQWQRSDFISMDDFNSDNSKIDAAFGAMPIVKLKSQRLSSAAPSMTVSLADINLANYSRLFVSLVTSGRDEVYMTINDIVTGYDFVAHGGNTAAFIYDSDTTKLHILGNYCDFLLTATTKTYILNIRHEYHVAPVAPTDIQTLNIWYQTAGVNGVVRNLPTGTCCVIYGLQA